MKKIITIVVLGIILAVLLQLFSMYRVLARSTYQFFNLENITQIFNNEGAKTISFRVDNPTNRGVYIKNVTILIEKLGAYKGGFQPLDLRIAPGVNNLTLTFTENTKYGVIATDYILNQLNDYKLVIRGNWLGFIPFRYKINMKQILS